MAVLDIDHMEIKGLELLVDRIWIVDVRDVSVNLQTVVVDDHTEIVKLFGSREHGSLPDLAFLDLAVSEQCVDAVVFLLHLRRQRHADCAGDSLSQRARAHVDSGQKSHGRMSLKT